MICVWRLNCTSVGGMFKIRRSEDRGFAIFALSGRIEEGDLPELRELLDAEAKATKVALNLAEVKLVDREAIRFLAACETRGIELKDCPSYIRRWIGQGSDISHEP
jgi:hypothetical protein